MHKYLNDIAFRKVKNKFRLLTAGCLLVVAYPSTTLYGQTTLQVVTKTVQKSVSWKNGYQVEITGEKAEVEVVAAESASAKSVQITAELIARHPSLDTAKIDLEAWKFVVTTIGKKIYIRAYIGVGSVKNLPTSNLKAKIFVKVPENCPVNLTNKYGKAKIDNIAGAVRLSGEFCNFTLSEIKGPLQIDTEYGNVDAQGLNGKVDISGKGSDITLQHIKGDCSVKSEYGPVVLESIGQSANITVTAGKADVRVEAPEPLRHSYSLRTRYGEIQAPLSLQLDPAAVQNSKELQLELGADKPRIKVETNFGKIVVQRARG